MKIGQTFSYLEGRWKKHNICPHAAASIFYFKTLLQKYGFWNVSIASESYLFEHVFFAKFWMTQLNWSARWSRAKVTDTHVNRANTIGSHFTLASDKQRKKKQSNKKKQWRDNENNTTLKIKLWKLPFKIRKFVTVSYFQS